MGVGSRGGRKGTDTFRLLGECFCYVQRAILYMRLVLCRVAMLRKAASKSLIALQWTAFVESKR